MLETVMDKMTIEYNSYNGDHNTGFQNKTQLLMAFKLTNTKSNKSNKSNFLDPISLFYSFDAFSICPLTRAA